MVRNAIPSARLSGLCYAVFPDYYTGAMGVESLIKPQILNIAGYV